MQKIVYLSGERTKENNMNYLRAENFFKEDKATVITSEFLKLNKLSKEDYLAKCTHIVLFPDYKKDKTALDDLKLATSLSLEIINFKPLKNKWR